MKFLKSILVGILLAGTALADNIAVVKDQTSAECAQIVHFSNPANTYAGSVIGGISNFVNLVDTPASYAGAAGRLVSVKAGEDGLEFVTAAWGDITGTLSNQTDLWADLTNRYTKAEINGFGFLTSETDPLWSAWLGTNTYVKVESDPIWGAVSNQYALQSWVTSQGYLTSPPATNTTTIEFNQDMGFNNKFLTNIGVVAGNAISIDLENGSVTGVNIDFLGGVELSGSVVAQNSFDFWQIPQVNGTNVALEGSFTPPATNSTTTDFDQTVTFPSIIVAGQLIDGSVSTISVANVAFDADFVPDASNAYDIGSALNPVNTGYFHTVVVATNTLYFGDTAVSLSGGTLAVGGTDLALVGGVGTSTNLSGYNDDVGFLTSIPSSYLQRVGGGVDIATDDITNVANIVDTTGTNVFDVESFNFAGSTLKNNGTAVLLLGASGTSTNLSDYNNDSGFGVGDVVKSAYNVFANSNRFSGDIILPGGSKLWESSPSTSGWDDPDDVGVLYVTGTERKFYTDTGAEAIALVNGARPTLKDDEAIWHSEGTATNGLEIINYQTMTNWVTQNPPTSTPPANNTTTTNFTQSVSFPQQIKASSNSGILLGAGEEVDLRIAVGDFNINGIGGLNLDFTGFDNYYFDSPIIVGTAIGLSDAAGALDIAGSAGVVVSAPTGSSEMQSDSVGWAVGADLDAEFFFDGVDANIISYATGDTLKFTQFDSYSFDKDVAVTGFATVTSNAVSGTQVVNYQTMTNKIESYGYLTAPPATNTTTVAFNSDDITIQGNFGLIVDSDTTGVRFGDAQAVSAWFNGADFQIDSLNSVANDEVNFTGFDAYNFDNFITTTSNAVSSTQVVNYQTMQAQKAWGIVGITNQATYTTPSTFTAVTNWLTTGVSNQVALTTTGLVCTVAGDYSVEAVVSAGGGNSATHDYQLQKNGTEILFGTQPRKLGTAGDVGNASISSQVTLASNDVVNLAVKADSGDVVIEKAHIRMSRLGD